MCFRIFPRNDLIEKYVAELWVVFENMIIFGDQVFITIIFYLKKI